ncbi:MAG: MerR family transcriptional regulator [Eggerthellaceae bacterium]|nr:MerR family transcriptional regulator [Eggerthellaceae bacterium]
MAGNDLSIGQVAKLLNTTSSTLRYYESEGLLTPVSRSNGGQRVFSQEDLEACRVIDCLKQSGLSIKEIKQFMELVRQGDASIEERLELFENRRNALLEEMERLQQTLGVLEYKCWYYKEALAHKTEDYVKSLDEQDIPAKHRVARCYLRSNSNA